MIGSVLNAMIGVVGLGFLAVMGTAGFLMAFDAGRRNRELSGTPLVEIGSIDDGEFIAIEGSVEAAGEGMEVHAPLRDESGFLVRWRIEEYYGHVASDVDRWTVRAEGVEAVEFLIGDGTERARVDVRKANLDPMEFDPDLVELDEPVLELGREEPRSGAVRSVDERISSPSRYDETDLPEVGENSPTQGDRRYYEAVMQPGSHVYALGEATRTDDGVRIEPTEDSRCYITNRDLGDVTTENRFSAGIGIAVGTVCYAVIVAGVLVVLGIL